MRSTRVAALLTAAAAVVALAALPAASASAAAPSTYPYTPQVGNSKYLVYLQNTTCDAATSLEVRAVDGTTRTLVLEPLLQKSFDSSCYGQSAGMSLSGHTLTVQVFTSAQGKTSRIFWWDLVEHAHGSHAVPAGERYWGAIPGGWVMSTQGGTTTLLRETTSGKISTYGMYKKFTYVTTGTHGLVLNRWSGDFDGTIQSNFRYLAYGAAKPVQLKAPAKKPDEVGMECTAVTSAFAACRSVAMCCDVESPYVQGITPLDGSASVRCTEDSCFESGDDETDDIDRTTASPVGVTDALTNGTLVTLQPDGTTATGDSNGAATNINSPLTTAYGDIIVLHASGDVTEQADVSSPQTTILSA